MKAIILGSNGQDGYYLSKLLEVNNIEVIGVNRSSGVELFSFESVNELVSAHKPDYIFHFAANSTIHHDACIENHQAISTGSVNIMESVFQLNLKTKIFLSGSGLQFVNTGAPVCETDPFEESSAYAMCRIQSVTAARYYRRLGLKVYVGYFFHHDSPHRAGRHINKRIVDFARAISQGGSGTLEIADLDVKKEFGFAGDVVNAVWTLVNQNVIMEATIGTGEAFPLKKWVDLVFGYFGLDSKDHVKLKNNLGLYYKDLVSDPSTIRSLGWKPSTTIDKLAEMMCRV